MNPLKENKTNHNNLQFATHKRLFSNLSGEHKSFFHGFGLDFRELRDYTTNDDIRKINWKVTARTKNPCINLFNEDKKLNITIVFLLNGGGYFGSKYSKYETMLDILGHLSFASLTKKDKLSTIFFSNKEELFIPPTTNKATQKQYLKTLDGINILGKEVDFIALEQYLLEKIKGKSLIFFIGDFFKLPSFKLLSAKHELYCAIVRDRFEEDLHLLGDFSIFDTNSNKNENIFLDTQTIKNYNQLLKSHDKELFLLLEKSKIRYKKIYTNEVIVPKLSLLLRD